MTEEQRRTRLSSILPVSSTQFEVDLLESMRVVLEEKLLQPFGSPVVEAIPVRYLWNPDLCPANALPHLATALSVDANLADFTVDQQRALIRDSFIIHQAKGTVRSVKQIIESLGWEISSFVEGKRDPSDNAVILRSNGGWAHFSIEINNTIPIAQAQAAAELVQATAPASRRLIAFDFSNVPLQYDGGVNDEGDYTFFYDGTFSYGSVSTDERVRV